MPLALGTAVPTGGDARKRGARRPVLSPAGEPERQDRPDHPQSGGSDLGARRPLFDAMGWQPRSLDLMVARSGGDVAEVAAGLDAPAADGQVREERGWWQRLM